MSKNCKEIKGYTYTNFKGNKVNVPAHTRCREEIPDSLKNYIDENIVDNISKFKNRNELIDYLDSKNFEKTPSGKHYLIQAIDNWTRGSHNIEDLKDEDPLKAILLYLTRNSTLEKKETFRGVQFIENINLSNFFTKDQKLTFGKNMNFFGGSKKYDMRLESSSLNKKIVLDNFSNGLKGYTVNFIENKNGFLRGFDISKLSEIGEQEVIIGGNWDYKIIDTDDEKREITLQQLSN